MKIVSKFKDYYDNVQGLAFDDSLLFVRQPLELKRGMPDFERYARVLSGLSDNVTFFVEQVEAMPVGTYHYRVLFKPQAILPNIDFKGSLSGN